MNPPEYVHPEPEFTPHEFEPDAFTQGTSCVVCGFDRPFHGRELGPEIEDDPRPEACPRCLHYAHSAGCPDAIPAYPSARPCTCGWEIAS